MEERDFDETFAPVVVLEFICIFISIACSLNRNSYQIDVKSAFLNGYLKKEVYVSKPKDF